MSDVPAHLQDLNPAQLEAVLHPSGPLLIFAGAGSGKTRVLTRKIAHLVSAHGMNPMRIYAVTFTNKAAREMKERVFKLLGRRSQAAWVSTFHSSCARLLRSHAKLLGFTENFAIYDTADSRSVLKRVYEKLNIDSKTIDPRTVMRRMDDAKNKYEFSDSIRNDRFLPQDMAHTIADIFDAYQKELLDSNAMDFGDLICNVVTLFKLEPKVLEYYQDYFSYLLIDEYQDTNKVQYMLVKMLSEKHRNVCVVGDDDQSIYAFRGATVENILNFKKDFPEAHVVTLNVNYRSTKNILTVARSVIEKNSRRERKDIITQNEPGVKVICYEGDTEIEEASFVVRSVIALLQNGVPHQEIAIFYRTNAQSRAIEEAMVEHNIPYEIYGSHKFYDRKEIKDILAYLRLLLNPADKEAFLRIINVPARGLGNSSIGALEAEASQKSLSLLDALRNGMVNGARFLTTQNKKKFQAFLELYDGLAGDLSTAGDLLYGNIEAANWTERGDAIASLLMKIAESSGYIRALTAEESPEAESRIENIRELCAVAAEYVRKALDANETPSFQEFLERTSLTSEADDQGEKDPTHPGRKRTDTVSLMTLHLCKGLEFDHVFLCGLEEGILPHSHSLNTIADLEEERRLCYVGITRARKRLHVSLARYRESFSRWGSFSAGASRFLDDFPDEVLERRY